MTVEEISITVKKHRKAAGLSRIACAHLAGVGKTALYDLEHGKPSVQLDTLLKILYVLNIQFSLQSPLIYEKG